MDEPFKSDKYDELFKIEKKDSTKKDSTKKLPVVEVKTVLEPDISVPMNFVDRVNKQDPQLNRAIDVILKQLK